MLPVKLYCLPSNQRSCFARSHQMLAVPQKVSRFQHSCPLPLTSVLKLPTSAQFDMENLNKCASIILYVKSWSNRSPNWGGLSKLHKFITQRQLLNSNRQWCNLPTSWSVLFVLSANYSLVEQERTSCLAVLLCTLFGAYWTRPLNANFQNGTWLVIQFETRQLEY